MRQKQSQKHRRQIEAEAVEKGWPWFRVTITVVDDGRKTTVEIPGPNVRHARISAMLLVDLRLRGETVKYDIEILG